MTSFANFVGKTALVTGGGTGIGRATALAFAQEGANVVVAGRRADEGQETVRQIKAAGGEATFIQTDVAKAEEVERLVSQTVAHYGSLDYAFNNAGNEGRPGPLVNQSEDDYDYTVDANLKGVFLSLKYEIAQMLKQGGGAIVNNASNIGHVGMPNMGIYAAAKHGVLGLTKTAALEYAKSGIHINAVSPGPITTPMAERAFGSFDNFEQIMTPLAPLGRVGQPEEIAQAVLWLCSEQSAFVTGHSLVIDGGITVQ